MRPDPYTWGWNAEALLLVPALTLAYVVVVRRFAVEPPRILAYALAQLLLLAVFVTPVDTLALDYLLSMHLFQNVVLAEWAPALLVLALPPGVASRVGALRAFRALTHPLVALPLWLANYFV